MPDLFDARLAHVRAAALSGNAVTGWLLDDRDRGVLLDQIPQVYPDLVAHHVTLTANTSHEAPLPREAGGVVIGIADDGVGVQALVVEIAGTSDRPDGRVYHITWSIDRSAGRTPMESNDVIAMHGWAPLHPPIAIRLRPAIVG